MSKQKFMIIGAVIVTMGLGSLVLAQASAGNGAQAVRFTELSPQTLSEVVSSKGMVESVEKSNVYSNSSLAIQRVEVEVGDKVEKGQVLCKLDTALLQLDLARQQVELNDLQKNQKTSTDAAMQTAQLDLERATDNYRNASLLHEGGALAEDEFKQTENLYLLAQTRYEQALANQAALNYEQQRLAIQRLERQLQEATITAPQAGTITASYAKTGAIGSGLLFVIEDTEDLKIVTKIKEYDITQLAPGMEVIIKSDATGNAEYLGRLEKIAPTSEKNTQGEMTSNSNNEFLVEVAVISYPNDLKIGMNTRLSTIISEKEGVYSVPFDAVTKDSATGETIVYRVENNSKGENMARVTTVIKGMETDFYIEISGENLHDGMKIINDAAGMSEGLMVNLSGEVQ